MNNKLLGMWLVVSTAAGLSSVASAQLAQQPSEGVAYEHDLSRSKFSVGSDARSRGDAHHSVSEGANGAFYVDLNTKAVLAVPTASESKPTAFSNDSAVHSEAVKQYFVKAGIPVAEVSGTHVTTAITGGGPVGSRVDASPPKLLYYTTHLERSLGGVRVESSLAFAAFDHNQSVISEGVYWPAIPAAVVARAQALAKTVSDESARGAYLAQVRSARPEVGDAIGEVKIIHTDASTTVPFEARAVYVVTHRPASGGMFVIDHFDERGQPVKLANSAEAARVDSPKQK